MLEADLVAIFLRKKAAAAAAAAAAVKVKAKAKVKVKVKGDYLAHIPEPILGILPLLVGVEAAEKPQHRLDFRACGDTTKQPYVSDAGACGDSSSTKQSSRKT